MNTTETKYYMRDTNNRIITMPKSTSQIIKPEAQSDYEKKKAAQKKAVNDEIKRVSMQQSLV